MNVTGPEDQEVASVTASLTSTITDSTSVASVDSNSQVPYHILDRSGETSSIGGDFNSLGKGSADNKSETDVLLRSEYSRIRGMHYHETSHHVWRIKKKNLLLCFGILLVAVIWQMGFQGLDLLCSLASLSINLRMP